MTSTRTFSRSIDGSCVLRSQTAAGSRWTRKATRSSIAFTRAGDAVEAASEAQDGACRGPVRVRIGVHTGEPLVTAEGYVGIDVHRAARIAGAAHGGQVVISQTTRDLVDIDSGLRDLGVHRLKDLTAPERLYQLGDGEFPPLRTLDATNLPVTASPLLGREQELERARGAAHGRDAPRDGHRAGGTGRPASRCRSRPNWSAVRGRSVLGSSRGLTDPRARRAGDRPDAPGRDDLLGYLRGKQLLLLLDNFEHLLAAAPDSRRFSPLPTGARHRDEPSAAADCR